MNNDGNGMVLHVFLVTDSATMQGGGESFGGQEAPVCPRQGIRRACGIRGKSCFSSMPLLDVLPCVLAGRVF